MAARIGKLRALAASVAVVLALGSACSDGGNPEVQKPNGDAGGSGGGGGVGGKPDSGGEDGPPDAGSDADATDAPPSPLRLGIIPVPPSKGDAGPSAADDKLAELDVLALGSRGVSHVVRWDALFSSPSVPSPTAWQKLQGSAQLYQSSARAFLLSVALVDRTLDARPSGSPAGWNSVATRTALDALIDKVFDSFGDELYALSFGNDLDRYLAGQSATTADDLTALVEHGLDYAKQHPSRPAALLVGATFSSDALAKGPTASMAKILMKSDVVVANYYALDEQFQARPTTQVAQDLDALSSGGTADAGEAGAARPVLLQEVGYPSAAENGSSPEQQRAFYQGLFQALTTRRERFPFVSVNGLHDPPPARCATEAAAFGAAANGAAVAARCSLGLRAADQTAKPALSSVLEALAAFANP